MIYQQTRYILEGQRRISGAKMSEESVLRHAQDDNVTDEFLREEIRCCTKRNMLFHV